MKKRNARAVLCTFSVIGFSAMAGTAAMAAEDSDRITIPYLQENAWDELAMTNDDAVSTGVNIMRRQMRTARLSDICIRVAQPGSSIRVTSGRRSAPAA